MELEAAQDAHSGAVKPDLVTDATGVPQELERHADDADKEAEVGEIVEENIQQKMASGVPLSSAEKQRMAVTLRLSGASYKQIGKSLSISTSYAHQLVSKALADSAHDSVEDLRRMQFSRYEHMLMLVWPDVNKRDLSAIHTATALIREENQLMGVGADLGDGSSSSHGDGGSTVIAAGDKDEYIAALREARDKQAQLTEESET